MTADRPATEPLLRDMGAAEFHDDGTVDVGAAPHHNRDGCNPYDEAHVAGKSGAAPRVCVCPMCAHHTTAREVSHE